MKSVGEIVEITSTVGVFQNNFSFDLHSNENVMPLWTIRSSPMKTSTSESTKMGAEEEADAYPHNNWLNAQ